MVSTKTETELVKDFFENNSRCRKLRLSINFDKMKDAGGSILIRDNLLYKLDLFNKFLGINNQLLYGNAVNRSKEDSYLLNYELILLNPFLDEKSLRDYFIEAKCKFEEEEIILYDSDNNCFIWIGQINNSIIFDVFYCLENDAVQNMKKDFDILKNNFDEIFTVDDSSSIDSKNSILYFLLLGSYSYLFTKQDYETQKLISEISSQFFDAQIKKRNYAYYSIVTLIALILEQNLVRIYHKKAGKFPSGASSIGTLNRINTGEEHCNLKKIQTPKKLQKGNYELIFNSGILKSYSKSERIYHLCNDFALNIRNRVFHYQDGAVLNLEKTIFPAIRYLVNILMEIEDNVYS